MQRTFSRKGRDALLQESPAPGQTSAQLTSSSDPFDGLLSGVGAGGGETQDAEDPFFFGSGGLEEHLAAGANGRGSEGRGLNSKGGAAGNSGRRAAGFAAPDEAPPAAPAGRPSGSKGRKQSGVVAPGAAAAAAAGAAAAAPLTAPPAAGKGACKAGAAARPASTAKVQQPKQRPPVKPTASLLSQRNPSASTQQRQQQGQDKAAGSTQAAAATGERKARPSVHSRPAAGAGAAAARKVEEAAAVGAAAARGESPGKRKVPAAATAATAAAGAAGAGARDESPSKRMKRQEGGSEAAAPVRAPVQPAGAAGQRPGGGGGRPSGGVRRVQGLLSGGLAGGALPAALHPVAMREQAAATTVVQAQALGEQQSITDDALWALDGLASRNGATARESLATLAEICSSRRGRLALRSGQMAADVLAAAGSLKLSSDPVQALGMATLLLCFCQADADAALLGRQEVAAAAAQLLQLTSSLDTGSATTPAAGSGAAAKLAAVLKERPYCLQLPPEERGCPLAVALAALADVLDPSKTSLNADPLKAALREAGVLQAAVQVAAEHAGALTDASPTIQTVRSLWRLHKALHLLESACFACPENEACLLEVTVSTGIPPMVATLGFMSWLVQQLALLSRQALIPGIKKDCLRSLLAVLLNATQNNPAGCAAVVAAGVLQPAAAVLAQVVRGGPKIRGVAAGEGELTAWHDVLSTCIALFINLVEQEPAWRQQLRQLELPDPAPAPAAAPGARVQLVPLLCSLLAVLAPAGGRPGDASRGAGGPARRASLGSGEVTADCLAMKEDRDTQSMAEVYAAVLLGFLIQDSPEARAQAAALLPGRSLEGVATAVERALDFYATMGAMTQDNVQNLGALLISLRADQPAAGGAEAGAAGMDKDKDEDSSGALSPVLG